MNVQNLNVTIELTEEQARRIAADWHSGQFSELYTFSSSGGGSLRDLLIEVDHLICVETEGTEKARELRKLRRYFVRDVPLGSASTGTLRGEDLYESFLSLLHQLDPKFAEDFDETAEGEELDDEVNCLMDCLNWYSPEGYYFGAHCGDGADFGFWPLEDYDEDANS